MKTPLQQMSDKADINKYEIVKISKKERPLIMKLTQLLIPSNVSIIQKISDKTDIYDK